MKVLDFGLAKAMEPASAMSVNAMTSPTLSIHATQAGMILGTAAYMSPEQAAGKPVDKRSDIWAFGVVVLEMLTGRPAFTGETMSHVLASVLRAEPDWSALPAHTPAPIRRLLRRCLEKDRRATPRFGRGRAARDRRSARTDRRSEHGERHDARGCMAAHVAVGCRRRARNRTGADARAVGAVAASGAPPRVTRTTITTSGPAALTINGVDRDLALSPDGTHVVYVGNSGTQLFVRALDALEPVAIASGAGLRGPFVSPDGQWVGFFASDTTLRKVAITGGPPITLARLDGASRGATWAPDDTIIFATSNPATGLQRVSAAGGRRRC